VTEIWALVTSESKGIKTFIHDHQCGDICLHLGLDKTVPLCEGDLCPQDGSVQYDLGSDPTGSSSGNGEEED